MRTIRLTSSIFAVAAVAAIAHSTYAERRIEVGAYGGHTSTSMHEMNNCPPPSEPHEPCPTDGYPHQGAEGVAFGAYGRVAVLPAVEVEVNLLYAQKGFDYSPEVRMHYLESPILVRIDATRDWSPARVFAYAGLAPAVLVSCHAEGLRWESATQMAVPYSDPCGTYSFVPYTPSRFDLSSVLGGGIGFQSPLGVFEIQARYVTGLLDNGTFGDYDGHKTVNTGFYVLAGFGHTLAL